MSNSQFILVMSTLFATVAVKSADVYEFSNDIRFKAYPSSENEYGNEIQPQDYVLGSWRGNKLKFGGNLGGWSRDLRTALRTDLLNNVTADPRFPDVQLITTSNPEDFTDVTSVQQCAELCLFVANLTDFGDLSCGGFQYSPTDSKCWPVQGWVLGKEYNDSCKNNLTHSDSEYCCIADACCVPDTEDAFTLSSCVKEYQPRRSTNPEDFAVYIRMFPPTQAPTISPTQQPTSGPTISPSTSSPSQVPTSPPTTPHPTQSPTISPSRSPTETTSPTASPTKVPTTSPTSSPTVSPSTSSPSHSPTSSPTTSHPTQSPTVSPSRSPTRTDQSPSQSSGSEQSSVVIVLVVVVVVLVVGIVGTVIYKHCRRRRRRREMALGQQNGQSQPDRGLEFDAFTTSNKAFLGTISPLATQFVSEEDELPVPPAVVRQGTVDEDGSELPMPQTSVQWDIIDGYGTLSDDHVRYATNGDNRTLVDANYDVVEHVGFESNKLRVPTVLSNVTPSESDTDYYANDW